MKTRAAPRQTEMHLHRGILAYLKAVLPGVIWHHSPNEFGGSGPEIARQIAKQRSMGTRKGWPDIEGATVPPIFFEVKAPGGRLSKAQRAVGDALQTAGCRWAVVHDIDEVRARLAEWGVATREAPPEPPRSAPETARHRHRINTVEALRMCDDGMSYAQIGQAFGVTRNAAYRAINRNIPLNHAEPSHHPPIRAPAPAPNTPSEQLSPLQAAVLARGTTHSERAAIAEEFGVPLMTVMQTFHRLRVKR